MKKILSFTQKAWDFVVENWMNNTGTLWEMVSEIHPWTPLFLLIKKLRYAFLPVATGFMMKPIMDAIEKGSMDLLKPYIPYAIAAGIGWAIMTFMSVPFELFLEGKKMEFEKKSSFNEFNFSYWFPSIWSLEPVMKTKVGLYKKHKRNIVRALENQLGLVSALFTAGAALYSVLHFDSILIIFMSALAFV